MQTDRVEWEKTATDAAVPTDVDFDLFTSSGRVSWNPNGNPAGTIYVVAVSENVEFGGQPNRYPVPAQSGDGTQRISFDFDKLTPNLPYFVRVEVLGHNGKPPILSDVPDGKDTTPIDVDILSLEPTGDKTRELKVSWNGNGNSPRTRYVVELDDDSAFNPPLKITTTVSGASEFIFLTSENLISNRQYFARVKAENGRYSRKLSTFTWPTVPVGVKPIAPSIDQTHRVEFEWDFGNNDPATRFKVELSSRTIFSAFHTIPQTSAGVKSAVFTHDQGVVWANQQYFFRVTALAPSDSGNADSEPVITSTFTAPLAAEALSDVSRTTSTITIAWSAPIATVGTISIQNAPGTHFQVNWGPESAVYQDFINRDGANFEFTLGNDQPLTPNATYFIEVITVPGLGNDFEPARKRLLPPPATNPNEASYIASGFTTHQTSMTAVWGANGNAVGTDYRLVIYSDELDAYLPPIPTKDTTFTTGNILFPASQYNFRVDVHGINVDVQGPTTITGVTKAETPTIDVVKKPDAKQLAIQWTSKNGDNVQNEVQQNSSGWTTSQSTYSHVFSGLSPNSKYILAVRSHNGTDPIKMLTTTETWTRASVPPAMRIISPLAGNALGVGFPETDNPVYTEYAIRMTTTTDDVPTDNQKFAALITPDFPGQARFDSDNPVWLTSNQWLDNNGKLVFSGLPDKIGYQVILISRNQMGQEEVGNVGLDIKPSAGVPILTLETAQGIAETNVSSHLRPVYFNSKEVPILGTNSSHFNVLWSIEDRPINENNINSTYGWNGFIDPARDCPNTNHTGFPLRDAAVKGFCAEEEGVYYLNVSGTVVGTTGVDVGNIVSTTSFRVFIDTTPPVPTELQLSFTQTPFEPLPEDTLFGNPKPYFVWATTDTSGKADFHSPIVGWAYSVSIDSTVVPARSTDTASNSAFFGFMPYADKQAISPSLHEVTSSTATVYYRVRGYDQAGNWTADPVPEFRYSYTLDQSFPELEEIQMQGVKFPPVDTTDRYAAVLATTGFVHLTFSEPMLIPNNSLQLMLLRGPDGVLVNRTVALTPSVSDLSTLANGQQILPFSSIVDLEPGSLYRFFSSSKPVPTDRANNALRTKLDMLFYTAMDPPTAAVFVSEDGNARVHVNSFALGTEPVGLAINDRPEKVSVAGSPGLPSLLGDANDALGRQNGGVFKKIFVAKELTAFKTNGEMRTQAFPGSVQMVFDYTNFIDSDGRLGGTSIKAKDLVIYELDERTGVWDKMPDSRVDEGARSVSAQIRHNGTYALGGTPNYDLSSAHPYPVPFRSSQHSEGISFTGLSSFGSIKILTLDGQLVKTLVFNGESSVPWDPVQSDSGDTVASDVYLYIIENDKERVVGKLMVIR